MEVLNRAEIEKTIETLIALLDVLDGDPDNEESDPPEAWLAGSGYDHDDREDDDEREFDPAEAGIGDWDALEDLYAAQPVNSEEIMKPKGISRKAKVFPARGYTGTTHSEQNGIWHFLTYLKSANVGFNYTSLQSIG